MIVNASVILHCKTALPLEWYWSVISFCYLSYVIFNKTTEQVKAEIGKKRRGKHNVNIF